jgi:HPt (histidine-containing phosphotransfer) domain-containing protein
LDVSALKALIGDNESAIREVLREFAEHSASIVAELRAACRARQPAVARAAAHKLKSSARAIGALVLGELCADLERAGEAADIATLTEKLPLFDKEMTAVDSYLRSL